VLAGAFFVGGLAVLLFLASSLTGRRGKPEDDDLQFVEPVKLTRWDRLLLAALPLVLGGIIALVIVEVSRLDHKPLPTTPTRPAVTARPGPSDSSAKPNRPERTAWIVAGGVAATVLIGSSLAIVAAKRRARRRTAGQAGTERAGRVEAELGVGIGAVETERDPRRAVIKAYSAMESALARAGLRRKRSEAPREYLQRALLELEVSAAPADRLTRLFERARFSRAPIGDDARHEALLSLRAVRAELGGAE
jgi:hypothetical protein